MKELSKEKVLELQNKLIERYGGTQGIRDEGLLDSALNAPFQTFDGAELYPGILKKAARLGFGLVTSHAFIDGNKRIGTHVMMIFLRLNGVVLAYIDDELTKMILAIAAGQADENDLYQWLANHRIN